MLWIAQEMQPSAFNAGLTICVLGQGIVNFHWCRNSNGFSTIFNLRIWMVLKSLVDTCSLDHNLDKLLSGCTIKLWRSIVITKSNPITARELPKILPGTRNISETNWCRPALQTRPRRATLNLLIVGQDLGRFLSFSGKHFQMAFATKQMFSMSCFFGQFRKI